MTDEPRGPQDPHDATSAAHAAHLISSLRAELDRLEKGVAGAEHFAHSAADRRPGWLRPNKGEARLPVIIVIAVAITLQRLLPNDLQPHPAWLLPGLEAALSLAILVSNPGRISRPNKWLRTAGLLLTALISLANAWSAAELIHAILTGTGEGNDATGLLGRGLAVYGTNIIVFGLWYWEFDRGGPAARARAIREYPDFLFPQQSAPEVAPAHWAPQFLDYLWLSYTNATAFSPTDVMPLSRWAKQLMFVQSAISLTTIGLVIARAVNIFK